MKMRTIRSTFLLVIGLGFGLLLSPTPVAAENGKLAFNANATMSETLMHAQTSKTVVKVYLNNGNVFEGAVSAVGKTSVVLTKLSGREFFDAVIALGEISAIEARVRAQ